MKNFDLDAAKRGAAVMTMHGHRVKILCFDKKGELPVVATVDFEDHEVVYDYFEDGTMPHPAPLWLTLMMRDDDYLEKLERGEYGNHIDDKREMVDPTIKQNLNTDREYWRRVYAGQAMQGEISGCLAAGNGFDGDKAIPGIIAKSSVMIADALIKELEKDEKVL
jgi:hypothetical protein|nr:MAG TPA: hypothetical protein [Bacteriophage sp.]